MDGKKTERGNKMQRENSSSILGIVYSTPARRAGLAVLAVALLLCAASLMGSRRVFLGGARALAADPQGTGTQTATAPTVPVVRHAQFQPPRSAPATFDEPTGAAKLMASGAVRPLSLATEDFNEDGWPDLVAGYATASGDGVAVLYFGDRDAYAPEKPETLAGIARNRYPVPFLTKARAFTLPEAPDFLAAGDFNKGGNPGLLVGARGSQQLYFLAGDGRGDLGAPQSVALPGTLTAMATGHIGRGDSSPDVAVGVVGINGPELLIYKGALGGLFAPPVAYSLDAEATSLKIGNLDDDPYGDVAIVADGSLFILHGQLWGPGAATGIPRSAAPELESVPLSSDAQAFAIGDFIWERNDRMEIAVLSGSGVQILSRGTPDKRPFTVAQIRAARQAMAQLRQAQLRAGTPPPVQPAWQPGATQPWQVAQSINVVAAGSASDLEAVTTALPNRAPQSVLLVGASASQIHLLTEPPGVTNASPTSSPTSATGSAAGAAPQSAASWSDDVVATGGAPAAVLPMRVNVSAQPGLVTLNHAQVTPLVINSQQGDPITVNRTDDTASASACAGGSNDCSLRGAIIYANANPGTTIKIPAGTYTLTIGEESDPAGGDDPDANPAYGDLDINANVTIVGAGAGSTIISANFPIVDGQDGKIFGVNQDGTHDGLQVSISGVTLEGARNSVGNNDPTFAQTGGALDFYLTGTGVSYTLSSCVIQNNTNVHSYGGGIDVDSGGDNTGTNHGLVTISNCTIVGNTTQAVNSTASSGANCAGECAGADAVGGGIRLGADIHDVVISNSTISGNQTCAGSSPTGPYEGGGIWILHTNGGTISIHATAIGDSVNGGNQSASRGGGISMGAGVATVTLTIDQGSAIQDNVSGTLSSGTAEGGGIYIAGQVSASLNQVTITGNSLSSNTTDHRGGGGIAVGEVTSPVTVGFSRIAGNSASGSTGTGLHKDDQSGTVTATDNWWGCNAGPSVSPCDTAAIDSGSGSLSFDPWLVLSLTPSSPQNVENGGTIPFTADLNHDSDGNPVPIGSNVPDGTPVSFGTTGGIGSDNPSSTTTTSGAADTTFTASTVGSGTVTTTVDSQTVSTATAVYAAVTIASSPSGESFTVTGGTACAAGGYTTPQTLDWSAASCTVQFTSPVSNGTGAQLAFSNWSDGDTNNPRTITTPASATTFTANFVQQYQLTTAVSPAAGGAVTAPTSGTFLNSGAAVSLTATANSGYTFNNWSVTSGSATLGNANSASTTVTLSSGPATVQANFIAPVSVTIASKLNGSASTGLSFSVSGTGCQPGSSYSTPQVLSWVPGSTCTVTFNTPQAGGVGTQYAFTQWDDNASPSNSRVFSVPASATTYTGDFTTQYLLTTAVSPAGAGTATPSTPTYYNINSTPAIQATANSGYAFANWSSTGGAVASPTSASTTVTMSAPTTVTANFNVGVTVTTSPAGLQFTVDGTPYTSGTPVFVTPGVAHQLGVPTPQSGGAGTQYVFTMWSDSVTSNPRSVTLSAPASFTADFTTQYQLTTAVSPAGGGTVTTPASGTYLTPGTATTLSAAANAGYIFNNWSVTSGSATFGNANSASTTVTLSSGPATVQANFLPPVSVTIASRLDGRPMTGFSFSVSGAGCQPGSYSTSQVLAWSQGSTCTVTFNTPQGPGNGTQYAFREWLDNRSHSNSRVFSVPATPTTYTGDFTTQYLLTTAVSPAGTGTVTPTTPTYFNINSRATIEATANTGYAFSNWTSTAGEVASPTSASTWVTMSAPTTVTANFDVGLTVTTSPGGLDFRVDRRRYASGTTVFVTPDVAHELDAPTPQRRDGTQYLFTTWSDGVTDNPRSVTLSAPASFTADFNTQYRLTTAVSPWGAGTVSPATGRYDNPGTPVALSATAANGYVFQYWTATSGGVLTNPTSATTATVSLSGPATVTANFGELPTSLSGLITRTSGPRRARDWTITLSNTGPGAANAAQINSLTLTQTGGAACSPAVTSAFPVRVGNIAPASTGSGEVIINFTGCPNNARFTTIFTFSANAGAVTGSQTLYNQFQ